MKSTIYRCLTIWVLPPLLIASIVTLASPEQEQENPKTYSQVLDELNIPHKTIRQRMLPIDLSSCPKDGAVNGLQPTRLEGPGAGLPADQLPGVRLVSSVNDVKEMDVAKKWHGGGGAFL